MEVTFFSWKPEDRVVLLEAPFVLVDLILCPLKSYCWLQEAVDQILQNKGED